MQMKIGQVSLRPQSTDELQRILLKELSLWHSLLFQFQNHLDAELEFDLQSAGKQSGCYLSVLEKLEIESSKSIGVIQSKIDFNEGIIASINELRKLSLLLKATVTEREKLRNLGSAALSTWVNSLYPAQNDHRLN